MEMFKSAILLFLAFLINFGNSQYHSPHFGGYPDSGLQHVPFGEYHRNSYQRPGVSSSFNSNPFNHQQGTFGQSFIPQDVTPTPDPSTLGCGTPPTSCPNTPYRSFDGSCNNLQNPGLGIPQSPYVRLLPQKYGDGISSPTQAKSGRDLPLSRTVSLVLFPDVPIEDPKFTLLNMQYGQIITHDMSMIAGSTQSTPHETKCCTEDGQLLQGVSIPDHCYPLLLPPNDPVSATNRRRTCDNFVRTITDRDRNCIPQHQPAEQLTAVNHYLDLSIIYGNSDQMSQQLREFQGGRLRVVQRRGKEWLPQSTNVTGTCPGVQSQDEPCYVTGDARVNQNPQLTQLHIVFVREHNRLVKSLAALNPTWDDERLFQEARRINAAQHQFITYYEWLPIFLGIDNSLKNRIIFNSKDFTRDYNPSVDPTVLNEHATAAFRFFHALIAGHLDLVTPHRDRSGSLRLSDWFNRPAIIEEGNNFDDLLRGLATQPEEKSNQYCTREITQFLFRNADETFGSDLKAFDVQRNRDHGLASYNDYRVYCGLPRAHSFKDFGDFISEENIQKLASLYESPDDVDLTVGGSLETLVPGTLSGPVFLCILTEQFYRTRAGDRFFFENGNPESGFNLAQLNEIRKTSMARLLCDNGNNIDSMQPHAFERVSHDNIVVSCDRIPSPNLSAWKEVGSGGGGGVDHGYSSSFGGQHGYQPSHAFSHNYYYKK